MSQENQVTIDALLLARRRMLAAVAGLEAELERLGVVIKQKKGKQEKAA